MKKRTIEDVKSSELGHKGFAKYIDFALSENHTIEEIREYNEKFKFLLDGEPFEFQKDAKNIKGYYDFAIGTLKMIKELNKNESLCNLQ